MSSGSMDKLRAFFQASKGQFVQKNELLALMEGNEESLLKSLKEFQKSGYLFEQEEGKLRLLAEPDYDIARNFSTSLMTEHIGQNAIFYQEVSSTQDVAKQLVSLGAVEGTLVVSDRQTKGRGRMERNWHSPGGKGIWASLIIRPRLPLEQAPQFTLLTAVAICQAIEKIADVQMKIKWPNDLLFNGKKICGILTEMINRQYEIDAIVIGFGVNINHEASDFPPDLVDKATSLSLITKKHWDRGHLLRAICEQFEKLYKIYVQSGFAPIKILWESYATSIGKRITARTVAGTFEGEAIGIDPQGVLLLKLDDGKVKHIYSADLSI